MGKIKSSKKIATYSLLFMGAGFVATVPFQDSGWMSLIHGGFEAGLVGGLADWFAVTALFRHPLGIPIPHTALLPNNRKRLTEGLISVIKNDWLSKDSIQEKVKNIPFMDHLNAMFKREIRQESFKTMILSTTRDMLNNLEVQKITPLIKKQLILALSQIDIVPLLQTIRNKVIREKLDEKALDHLLFKIESWLKNKQTEVKLGKISMNALNNMEVSGFRKLAFKSVTTLLNEENLGQTAQGVLLRVLKNLQRDGDPNRMALLAYLNRELEKVDNQSELIGMIEKWRDELFNEYEPDELITEKLVQFRQKLISIVEEPEFIETKVIPLLEKGLDLTTAKSPEINKWIQQQIISLVEENHSKIGDLVKENLNKLDNKTLVDLVENNIGKDLQWIRVNGALCGFVIGILLTGIKLIIH